MNRLADAASPYLLRHARDPVDWYPWGEEALERAENEDRPIFLSIGFATCHWCHVMARECFADEPTAELLNRHFIPVKVDREERPDIDRIYLEALRRLTGSGGWPATLVLTPRLEPFFGGTYFPTEDRDGLPGLRRLLAAIDEAWRGERQDEIVRNARSLMEDPAGVGMEADASADRELLDRAAADLASIYDREWGGLGRAAKFPSAPLLAFLAGLARAGDDDASGQLDVTLRHMATGGVYDHVAGGFHRYAIDRKWRLPHFEKTLVDNALIVREYVAAWKRSGDALYRRVAQEILDYLLAELRHERGGFVSGQDAESDGVEGGFYLWGFGELTSLVGHSAAAALGATPGGNWHGRNVLCLPTVPDDAVLAAWRERLTAARGLRVRPARDEKVVAGWNALAATALAEAATSFGNDRYLAAALEAVEFVLAHLCRSDDGRLLRSWYEGRTSVPGFLDDYAFLGLACLSLHQATLTDAWLQRSLGLADETVALFADPDAGRLFPDGGRCRSTRLARGGRRWPRAAVRDVGRGGATLANIARHRRSGT